jgi:hypothetical protein
MPILTKPVPELIGDVIVGRVEQISVVNGYSLDVRQVGRPSRLGAEFRYAHLSVRVDQPSAVRVTELDCPGNPPAICWAQQYDLVCHCRNSNEAVDDEDGEAESPYVTNVNDLAAAVQKAVTVGNDWYTFGGYAFDSTVDAVTMFMADDNEHQGATITVNCRYRVSENNPMELRA